MAIVKRGNLRFSEEQFRDEAAKRDRWKAATSPVGVGTVLENSVAKGYVLARANVGCNEGDPSVSSPDSGARSQGGDVTGRRDGHDVPERDVLKEVLGAVTYHPRVAWAERMNSGVMQQGGRYVRFGFVGCPDIVGQLRDGRFLAIEVKRAGKDATEKQLEFLGRVHRNHGLAFVARSAADARNALNEYGEAA